MPKPRYNQNITTTIHNLGINGEGVGKWHGFTIFADGVLPGEMVRGRLIDRHRSYGRVQPAAIENPSPFRVEPICPIFNTCGGCQIMHLEAQKQLEFKRQQVVQAMEKIGRMTDLEVADCVPSPSSTAYRNKIQLPVKMEPEGMKIGLYARNSHEIIEIERCYVHCDMGESVFRTIKELIKQLPNQPDNLRYLIIKSAVNAKQALVIFVTSDDDSSKLEPLARAIVENCPDVKGVIQNINTAPGNVVLGSASRILMGQDFIIEELSGLRFKIAMASFFQVNTAQAALLYQKALELAELKGTEKVLDAYCGVGTIALLAARHAKHVVGVECVPEAIENAKFNAQLNQCLNVDFVCDEAEVIIKKLDQVDVALLNPPRKGCDISFLESLCQLSPKRIVYISCDPGTLARDLAILRHRGYHVGTLHPFDMFPQTAHVECVVALSKDHLKD